MSKSARSRAEELFTATQNKDHLVLEEKEKAQRERADHVAGLRALRLAKEAADKDAALEADATKAATKTKKPSRLPQDQRRQS